MAAKSLPSGVMMTVDLSVEDEGRFTRVKVQSGVLES